MCAAYRVIAVGGLVTSATSTTHGGGWAVRVVIPKVTQPSGRRTTSSGDEDPTTEMRRGFQHAPAADVGVYCQGGSGVENSTRARFVSGVAGGGDGKDRVIAPPAQSQDVAGPRVAGLTWLEICPHAAASRGAWRRPQNTQPRSPAHPPVPASIGRDDRGAWNLICMDRFMASVEAGNTDSAEDPPRARSRVASIRPRKSVGPWRSEYQRNERSGVPMPCRRTLMPM